MATAVKQLRPLPSFRASAGVAAPVGVFGAGADHPGDRVFVTLLSLNFMLLAFFVVLGTTASFDRERATPVVKSVRLAFSRPDASLTPGAPARLTARQALQAGVWEAFAEILPALPRFVADNSDRVDLAVQSDLLEGTDAGDAAEALYDRIARLMAAAPAGFRYELLLRARDAGRAADALVRRGVSGAALLIGSQPTDDGEVYFSFLLFEDDAVESEDHNRGAAAFIGAAGGGKP